MTAVARLILLHTGWHLLRGGLSLGQEKKSFGTSQKKTEFFFRVLPKLRQVEYLVNKGTKGDSRKAVITLKVSMTDTKLIKRKCG